MEGTPEPVAEVAESLCVTYELYDLTRMMLRLERVRDSYTRSLDHPQFILFNGNLFRRKAESKSYHIQTYHKVDGELLIVAPDTVPTIKI